MTGLTSLLSDISRCRICEDNLPAGPRPVLQCAPSAKILIAGQAPGKKVHASGIPFDDPSGNRLRGWLGIDRTLFYDASAIAILPMGFCYPGTGPSGDLPPRPECAAQWRRLVLAQLQQVELTLVIGQYAQRYHLNDNSSSLTELVRRWKQFWPDVMPLPHPSPRNNRWLKQNAWFEQELLPELRMRVQQIIRSADS